MRPVAEEFVGSYVKAIHDFHSGLPGELTLTKNDIFKVTKVVDKNWLHGRNKNEEGNFPVDFVEKITLPSVDGNQKAFAAVENFPAQQDGDLAFRKGSIIVGLQQIDDSWWRGKVDGSVGIFPVTHVMELEIPKLLRNRSKSVHSSEPLFAQALCDSVAQLDEELSFKVGDIITVTEVIDEDWYQGEAHGKSGMFLASCVQLLNENTNENSNDDTVHYNHSFVRKHTNDNRKCQSDSRREECNNERNGSFSEVPNYSEDSQRQRSSTSISYTSENTKSHNADDAGVTPYARTLYPFVGELDNELTFEAHDIVTLIQHIDEQWIEGELDGKIGLFPASYVEIVVDCPYAYPVSDSDVEIAGQSNFNNSSNGIEDLQADTLVLEADKSKSTLVPFTENLEDAEEQFALVLYSFDAETSNDLSVVEGETVTVIKQLDENWILVKNEQGNSGMCPVSFVELIGTIPEFTEIPHVENGTAFKESDKTTNAQPTYLANSKPDSIPASFERTVLHTETDLHGEENTKLYGAIKASKSLDNLQPSTSKVKSSAKPPLKPKPLLAPKPTLKVKPPVSPRLSRKAADSSHQSDQSHSSIPKSESSSSLSGNETHQNVSADTQMCNITKSNSMFEINESEAETRLHTTQSTAKSGGHSGSLTSISNSDSDPKKQWQTESKKTFENWDVNQPIENFIQSEFLKAAESRSRSGSNRSSSSGDSMQRSGSFESKGRSEPTSKSSVRGSNRPVSWAVGSSAVNMSPPKQKTAPNYSRTNFYSDKDFTVGNSTFFVNDPEVSKIREGPPPWRKFEEKENDTDRKSSLRKPAPARPMGPRIAPAPSKTPLTPLKTDSKHIPARPAPARPHQTPARPTRRPRQHTRPAPPRPQAMSIRVEKPKASPDNLMSFSPTNSSIDAADTVDSEAVIELKSRIAEMEKDLENCKKSKGELEQMEQNIKDGDTTEIHDNIQFYNDNIQGITNELEMLKDNLSQMCPKEMDKIAQEKAEKQRQAEEQKKREEMKKKLEEQKKERREKRGKVIEEIVDTEKDFLTSLNLIIETFLGQTTEKHEDVDREKLFGNIEEVADISQRLLIKLEEALNGKDFEQQVVGTCFTSLAEDMKNVYAPYCRNHDDVITLIEKYNENPEAKEYLDRLLDELREKHVVFDLEALLIKPVQRILKYPLLLNALLKATEDSHPDKPEILQAISAMTDVAAAINEYKRRKDLVYKYKKDTGDTLGDKLSKLSLHSLKKKSSRIRERFSVNMGFIYQTRDENFDREETRYRNLEKIVRVFMKDVQNYMDQVVEIVNCQECMVADIEDYYLERRANAELQQYQASQNKIQGTFLPDFKSEVEDLVQQPLSTLLLRFEAPNKVIQKRYDKLLDYDTLSRKPKDDKVAEKATQTAKQDYEALNAQLLDELPKLYQLAFQLFKDCVGSLVRAQKEFTDKILKEMYSLLQLQVLTKEGVIEVFNIKHVTIVDRLAMLSFMPKGFSPRVAEQKADKKSKKSVEPQKSSEVTPQLDSQRIFVTQQYPASKLFKVVKTYITQDVLDICVSEGDIVGVIIDKDPMGNKERWYIDNGAQKGFVPKKVLTQYDPTPPRNPQAPQQYQPASPQPAYESVSSDYSSQGTSQYFNPQIGGNQTTDSSMSQFLRSNSYGSQSTGSVQSNRMSTGSYQSITNSAILHNLQEDDMDFALDEDMTPAVPDQAGNQTGQENPAFHGEEDELELYYAEYPFTARNENELSLFEHQVVTVLHKHDQEGNLEWWYVDADGTFGYAPAAYLKKMDTHGDPT